MSNEKDCNRCGNMIYSIQDSTICTQCGYENMISVARPPPVVEKNKSIMDTVMATMATMKFGNWFSTR